MGKLLSWVVMGALGWLAWRLVALVQRKAEAVLRERAEAAGQAGGAQPRKRALRDERIVPCAHCGVHFPVSEAVTDGESSFCCTAHRDAHRAG